MGLMQYELPNDLHHEAKSLARALNLTLKAFIIRAISNEVKRTKAEQARQAEHPAATPAPRVPPTR